MARYTLTVPDSKIEQVLAYLKSLRGVKVEEAADQPDQQGDDIIIHDLQKKILDEELEFIENYPDKTISLHEFKIAAKEHL